jgi:hypothetical protein
MATEKQIQANIRNARRSTGPRTTEGKAKSSRNALKTGLYANGIVIGYEDPSKLAELERQFTDKYHPATPTERSLVDSLIHLEWLLRRYRWLETEVWKASQDGLTSDQLTPIWPGHAFIGQPAISRVHRLRNSTQKAFRETLADLLALQSARAELPEPIETTNSPDEIGFVPSNQFTDAQPDEIGFVPSELNKPTPDRREPPAPPGEAGKPPNHNEIP